MISSRPACNNARIIGGPLRWAPLLIIAAAALAAVAPFAWMGNASGHDFEFHMYSWLEVVSQWKQGVFYPHWAAGAHWEYGEPRFLFYPPASWHLGALIGAVLPWKMAPGVYIWIALTLSGLSMFVLARRFLTRPDAIFAAVLYALNPYIIIIVYWRSALAELLAACLMPLLLLLVLRIAEGDASTFLPLSLVVAAGWLTNAPSGVMLMYSLALLVVVVIAVRREWRFGWYCLAATLLGIGLAAFYLLPAAYETRWIDIGQVFAAGVRPSDNFLMTMIGDPDHNRFNMLVTLAAAVEMAILACSLWMGRRRRKTVPQLWFSLLAWASLATCLMLSFTLPLWTYLPKLRFVQLPWRWLLCLGVPFALLTTIGIRRWPMRALLFGVLFGVILVGAYRVQQPWWDEAADITEMVDAIEDHVGYEGTDEYVPVAVDPDDINRNAPKVRAAGSGKKTIDVMTWDAHKKIFFVVADAPVHLVLRLFDYPAWRASVDGKSVPLSRNATGEVTLSVPPGNSTVRMWFGQTWDRTLGIGISMISVVLVIYFAKRRQDKNKAIAV